MQQMREAFPWDQAPRFVLRDRDAVYRKGLFATMTRAFLKRECPLLLDLPRPNFC